jgi:hypothetical protein
MLLAGCNGGNKQDSKDTTTSYDTLIPSKRNVAPDTARPKASKSVPSHPQIYSNERFKEVSVEKTGEHTFVVKGKAQIFEAQFSWVIEDGHQELKQGSAMTDAGAPEWGKFNFTVDAFKKKPNSTLHLILFESSPKDGSRQYELPVVLY